MAPLRARLRVGVSSSSPGHQARRDGRHERDALLTEVRAPIMDWWPVDPEASTLRNPG